MTAGSDHHIGRYSIVREIGRGGMGVVYEAHDAAFERSVALKLLPQEQLTDDDMKARFVREARLIASLDHAAIVPVYDFDEAEGQPYFVMRLMPGGTLADRLLQGPLPAEEAVALVERLAPALDMAHQRSIIHRDLKPGNILFDDKGLPYLSDFGIAKLIGETYTADSRMIGTPAYMSPEQIDGRQPPDGRSDLYGMGILLWEMLTGDVPFKGDAISVAQQQMVAPLPPLRAAHPDLPVALEGVLSRALAKNPAERFATMGHLVRALRAAVPAPVVPSIAAAPPANVVPTSSRQRSRAVPIFAVIMLGMVLVGGIAALMRNQQSAGGDPVGDPVAHLDQPAAAEEVQDVPEGAQASSNSTPKDNLPALPTRAASPTGIITSTPMRVTPSPRATRTATTSPTVPPTASSESSATAAPSPVSVARGIFLNAARANGSSGLIFSGRVVGVQPGESVALLYATNAQLSRPNIIYNLTPSGEQYQATVNNLGAGMWWWTMVIRSSQGATLWHGDTQRATIAGAAPPTVPPPPLPTVTPVPTSTVPPAPPTQPPPEPTQPPPSEPSPPTRQPPETPVPPTNVPLPTPPDV